MLTIELEKIEEGSYSLSPTWERVAEGLGVSRSVVYRYMELALGMFAPYPRPTPELISELEDVKFWCSCRKKYVSSYYTPYQYFLESQAGPNRIQILMAQLREGIDVSERGGCTLQHLAAELEVHPRTVQRYMSLALGMDPPFDYSVNLLPELRQVKFWCSCRELISDYSYTCKSYYAAKRKGTLSSHLLWLKEQVRLSNTQ